MKKIKGPGIFLTQFDCDKIRKGSLLLLSYDDSNHSLNDEFSQVPEAEQ
jgi:hypothetical protein